MAAAKFAEGHQTIHPDNKVPLAPAQSPLHHLKVAGGRGGYGGADAVGHAVLLPRGKVPGAAYIWKLLPVCHSEDS